jgi:hypothetical protein
VVLPMGYVMDARPAPGEEVTSLALGATRFNPRL